jgi:hypothetical protein
MSEKGENKMKGTSISDHDTAGPEETMKHDKAASCTISICALCNSASFN